MIKLDLVGKSFGPVPHEYNWRDIVIYHLGIGFKASDLPFVYENAAGGLQVCPTYAVIPPFDPYMDVIRRLGVDFRMILHGEAAVFLHRRIPPGGTIFTTTRVANIYDKSKAALVALESETTDKHGELLFRATGSIFCRGEGGWGGDPGPKAKTMEIPKDRRPDFEISYPTFEHQAALYRLSGDHNPLHIDPALASIAGFPRPILHGLCTFGFVGRAIIEGGCAGDVTRLRELGARFSNVVYPGQTITTRGWKMKDGLCLMEASTETASVLSNCYARLAQESVDPDIHK